MRRTIRSLALVLMMLPVPAAGEQPEVLFEPLAVTGLPAPGTPTGVVFDHLGSSSGSYAMINDSGVVAFFGALDGEGVERGSAGGVWISRLPGQVDLLVRKGNPAPGFPAGTNLVTLGQPTLNSAGQVPFRGGVFKPDSDSRRGILIEHVAGNLSFLVELPIPLPGLPGAFLTDIWGSSTLLNDAGETAFLGSHTGDGVHSLPGKSIWGPNASGDLVMLAREGANPPGMGSPFILRELKLQAPVLNNLGQVAFQGTHGTWLGVRTSIFGPNGSVDLGRVVSSGQPAPGVGNGSVFWNPGYRLWLNDRGQIAFSAYLKEEANHWTPTSGSGYWLHEASGETLLVARWDAPLPGLASGRTVRRLSDLNLNDAGQIAFGAETQHPFEGPNEWGIWLRDVDGTFGRLVNTGQHAPGLPSEARFAAPGEVRLNQNGDVLFITSLTGFGFDPEVDSALYLLPYSGEPILVARSGDLLEVAPGDFRAVAEFALTYLLDKGQRSLSFNVLGQVAFLARFEDGSQGIFVAEIPAVTEDDDADGIVAVIDNCRSVPNPDQADTDGDGVGDACNDAEDADGDEYRDDLDTCPELPDDQLDRDGDGLGDACDAYPDDPDNEKAQLRFELAVCDDALLMCLDRRFFIDADGDGEEDSTDACPETPQGEAVDSAGCSLAQFCGLVNEFPRPQRLARCARSDWRNDEPEKRLPLDCAIARSGGWWWWIRAECAAR